MTGLTLTLVRIDPSGLRGTRGLIDPYTGRDQSEFIRTLELPWLDNRKAVSCIPKGEYEVRWLPSFRFKRHIWRVMDVPGRTGILIHTGNKLSEIRGCILVGTGFVENKESGEWEIQGSRMGMTKLNEKLKGLKKWNLRIL